jgi:hypothetical protein
LSIAQALSSNLRRKWLIQLINFLIEAELEEWGQPSNVYCRPQEFRALFPYSITGAEMASKSEGYTVTVVGPGHNFERAIDEGTANKIINLIMTGSMPAGAGGASSSTVTSGAKAVAGGGVGDLSSLNPKQFIAQKKPKTQYERIACIGYYLNHFRDAPQFVTDDITFLNTEAAQPPILNAPQIVRDTADKYGYLTGAGARNKQITALGEAVVEALPNRDAVTAAIAEHRTRKRRKRPAKKKR